MELEPQVFNVLARDCFIPTDQSLLLFVTILCAGKVVGKKMPSATVGGTVLGFMTFGFK